jgi:acetylornithine deacetylase/succinyl-diaminopimelate desuccinylase-like protein
VRVSKTSHDDEVIEIARELIRVDTTNGNETAAAEVIAARLAEAASIECEIVARDPRRGNLVARLPGRGDGPTVALVGHLDVVPAVAGDWTHHPFAADIDDDGFLFGRGALDMKGEVAIRTATLLRLAREGFQPSGDLLLVMAADEEDGSAEVGMSWLVEAHPEIRCDIAINEGTGQFYPLSDGRVVVDISVGEKGTQPVRVDALGEAGHASTPSIGLNAVPRLAELLGRIGTGMPTPSRHEVIDEMLRVLNTPVGSDGSERPDGEAGLAAAIEHARGLNPLFEHTIPAVCGTTMAPTRLFASDARNVIPARAGVELDCRVLPGTTPADVEREVRERLGDGVEYELSFPEPMVPGNYSPTSGPLWDAIVAWLETLDPTPTLLPSLDSGFTDSVYLRDAFDTVAYGFSPLRSTPPEIADAGYHAKDERVHIDDLGLGVEFHEFVVRRLLG